MATPPRPATVPPQARYNADQQWELGDNDAQGRRTGRWRWWRTDGSLIEDSESLAGELHGEKTWYYEDGNVCFRERNEHGKPVWRCCYRPKSETREGHPFGALDERLCEIEQSYTVDGWTTSQVLRDANGAEVAADLTVAPPRPAGVPPSAVFYNRPEMYSQIMTASGVEPGVRVSDAKVTSAFSYWEVGTWRHVDGAQEWRGLRKAYDRDGKLVRVAYANKGETAHVAHDGIEGEPIVAAAVAGDQAAVEELMALKAWSGPTAKLHAALLGFSSLAERLSSATTSAIAAAEKEPRRKGPVPADAIWVPSLGRFVKASLAGATVVGEATLWRKRGDVEHWRYEGGVRVFVDRMDYGKRVEEHLLASGPRRGSVYKTRTFEDEVCVAEEESNDDGTIIARRFDDAGRWRGERLHRDGVLLEERWWMGDALVASLRAGDGKNEIFEGSGVKGTTAVGIDGGPRGIWQTKLGDADFAVIKRATFARVPKATLPHFAEQLALLQQASPPTAIADLVGLDWTRREGWFGHGTDLGFFLRGLAADDDQMFAVCLDELRETILHQSTISDAGAPLLTGMLRLLPTLRPQRRIELVEFLCDCWSECRVVLGQMSSLDGTVARAYVRAHGHLEAAVAEAPNHQQHAYMQGVVADIGSRDKGRVLARMSASQDSGTRSEALASLVDSPDVEPADVATYFGDADPLMRLTAGYVAAIRFKQDAPKAALTVLASAIADCERLAPVATTLAWAHIGLPALIARGLRYIASSGLDLEGARAHVPALAPFVGKLQGEQLMHFTHEMLGLTFGQCELPFAPGFPTWLDAIASARVLEKPDGEHVAERLGSFGIPGEHEALVEVIARVKAAPEPAKMLRDIMHGDA